VQGIFWQLLRLLHYQLADHSLIPPFPARWGVIQPPLPSALVEASPPGITSMFWSDIRTGIPSEGVEPDFQDRSGNETMRSQGRHDRALRRASYQHRAEATITYVPGLLPSDLPSLLRVLDIVSSRTGADGRPGMGFGLGERADESLASYAEAGGTSWKEAGGRWAYFGALG